MNGSTLNALAPGEQLAGGETFADFDSAEAAALLDTLLEEHAERTAERVWQRLGGALSLANLPQYLNDDTVLRAPSRIVFDAAGLEENQFGEARIDAENGQRRCIVAIHPRFEEAPLILPYFVAYLSPVINYGPIVSSELCERYGARLVGMDREEFYAMLCRAVDAHSAREIVSAIPAVLAWKPEA